MAAAALSVVMAAACDDGDTNGAPDLRGTEVEVVAVWQDVEAAAFEQVLDRFEALTGATVRFTSTAGEDITAVLDERIAGGAPPDVAVLPQPGLLVRYAEEGTILPIDDLVGDEVRARWAPVWQDLGSVGDRLYGVWFKAANKSLLWYSIGAFEANGAIPPDDLAGLGELAAELSAAGVPAFSLATAPSDAWTLTDWFENLYLRLAGPARYDDLTEHRIPWTDDSVTRTLAAMASLLDPAHVVAADGASTTFPRSVAAVFSPRPAAAMVMEGDFVPGVVADTSAEIGIDVDAFPFPSESPNDRYVVGGGDVAVLMRDTAGAESLVSFLASAEAAEVWAGLGGFVSANESVDLTVYPDPTTRRIARSMLEAGDGFRFDLSDLQPVEFGGTTGAGMWAELARFVADPSDVAGTAARLEAAAAVAWAGS